MSSGFENYFLNYLATSEGKVTAQAAIISDIPSPSRSGSSRGNEIFTNGIWYLMCQISPPEIEK